MDKRLKEVDLLDELVNTFDVVKQQLSEDQKHFDDTWKEHGLIRNGQNQEQRWFLKMQEYYQDYMENGQPIPWAKVMGETHIAMVRERKLK